MLKIQWATIPILTVLIMVFALACSSDPALRYEGDGIYAGEDAVYQISMRGGTQIFVIDWTYDTEYVLDLFAQLLEDGPGQGRDFVFHLKDLTK